MSVLNIQDRTLRLCKCVESIGGQCGGQHCGPSEAPELDRAGTMQLFWRSPVSFLSLSASSSGLSISVPPHQPSSSQYSWCQIQNHNVTLHVYQKHFVQTMASWMSYGGFGLHPLLLLTSWSQPEEETSCVFIYVYFIRDVNIEISSYGGFELKNQNPEWVGNVKRSHLMYLC